MSNETSKNGKDTIDFILIKENAILEKNKTFSYRDKIKFIFKR